MNLPISTESSKPRLAQLDPDFRRDPKTEHYCARCQKDFRPGQAVRWVYIEGTDFAAVIHPDDVGQARPIAAEAWHRIGLDCAKIIGLEFSTDQRPASSSGKPSECLICKRALNNPNDPLSTDCGGDCVSCMAEAGDPDCIAAVAAIKNKE